MSRYCELERVKERLHEAEEKASYYEKLHTEAKNRTGAEIWAGLSGKQRRELLERLDPDAGVRLIQRLVAGLEEAEHGGTLGEWAEAQLALTAARQHLRDLGVGS